MDEASLLQGNGEFSDGGFQSAESFVELPELIFPHQRPVCFPLWSEAIQYQGTWHSIVEAGIADGRAYALVDPRNATVEQAIIDCIDLHPRRELDLDVLQAVLGSHNSMVRFFITLTSTTSPWFAKAALILGDRSRAGTSEYAIMSRLIEGGAKRCPVTKEEGIGFSAWAESLGEAPSYAFTSLTMKELV